mmetsp:Transcript_27827/g.93038  ORF Transcript_27827/g.93038 Transcript_27827/m.93038 type:complete len:404 (+) Transcript_27827:285-1496(+)
MATFLRRRLPPAWSRPSPCTRWTSSEPSACRRLATPTLGASSTRLCPSRELTDGAASFARAPRRRLPGRRRCRRSSSSSSRSSTRPCSTRPSARGRRSPGPRRAPRAPSWRASPSGPSRPPRWASSSTPPTASATEAPRCSTTASPSAASLGSTRATWGSSGASRPGRAPSSGPSASSSGASTTPSRWLAWTATAGPRRRRSPRGTRCSRASLPEPSPPSLTAPRTSCARMCSANSCRSPRRLSRCRSASLSFFGKKRRRTGASRPTSSEARVSPGSTPASPPRPGISVGAERSWPASSRASSCYWAASDAIINQSPSTPGDGRPPSFSNEVLPSSCHKIQPHQTSFALNGVVDGPCAADGISESSNSTPWRVATFSAGRTSEPFFGNHSVVINPRELNIRHM